MTAARCVSTVLRLTAEELCHLFVRVSFGDQLHNLALPGREHSITMVFLIERIEKC